MTITILTACRNALRTLPDCLQSVSSQWQATDWRVEHFVLDGASGDGSVEYLREWAGAGVGRRFRSEEDGGFYHALNCGLLDSRGDIVGILNADDLYVDNDVLARVAAAFADPKVLGVYGDLAYVTADSTRDSLRMTRYWRAGHYQRTSFYHGWMPPHPTVFVRRTIYDRFGGFRADLASAADYEWLIRVMLAGNVRFEYIPHLQVAMRTGGMSNQSLTARLRANAADRRAWQLNNLRPAPWTFLAKPLRKVPQWLAARRGVAGVES